MLWTDVIFTGTFIGLLQPHRVTFTIEFSLPEFSLLNYMKWFGFSNTKGKLAWLTCNAVKKGKQKSKIYFVFSKIIKAEVLNSTKTQINKGTGIWQIISHLFFC